MSRRIVKMSRPGGLRLLRIIDSYVSIGETARHPAIASGGMVYAASANLVDVEAAIALASPGDTVRVPSTLGLPGGIAYWGGHLVVTKSLYIVGAGTGLTVITSGYDAPNKAYNVDPINNLISFVPATPADNPAFRLSGMTINCASKCCGILLKNLTTNICNKIRLDHIHLSGCADWAVTRYGQVYGVCDNSTLYGKHENYGTASVWTYLAYDYGDVNNFYYEDNAIYCDRSFLSPGNESPRYSFRHNSIYVTYAGNITPMFDAHGNQLAGQLSTQGGEIYENTIDCGGYYVYFFDQRGGKFLVYNNHLNNADNYTRTALREEYNDSICPPANNVISGQPQHVSDSYYWGNTRNGSPLPLASCSIDQTVDYGGAVGVVPQWNRDCWRYNPAFDGSSGVGVGLLAARPASGLTVGVGYWATDTETLYRATGATTWETYYTPYTYPHPLRGL